MTIRLRAHVLPGCLIAALVAMLVAILQPPGVAAAASSSDDWAQFQRGVLHHGVNSAEHAFTKTNVANLRTAFRSHFGDTTLSRSGPVVAGGVMYVAGFDGVLSAFDATGCGAGSCEPLWRGRTDNDIDGTPAVAGGLVFIGSADHFLYAFPASGCGAAVCRPRWKGHVKDAVLDSSPAVVDGVAYVGDYGGHLSAFRASGCGQAVCEPLWTGQGWSTENFGSPAVGGGMVYVTTYRFTPNLISGRLLAFPAGGCGLVVCQPTWTAELGGPGAGVTVGGDTLYVGSGTLFGDGINTNFHLAAYPAAGCGASRCQALRFYDTGDEGAIAVPALIGDVLLVSSQASPDPNTIGVVAAYPAHGCGRRHCSAIWTGVNFASGFESPPAVVDGIVFVGKGPASGFPVDAGVYAYDLAGCGQPVCLPIGFHQLGETQFYLGAPMAVAEHKVYMASNDNTDNHSNVYALSVGR